MARVLAMLAALLTVAMVGTATPAQGLPASDRHYYLSLGDSLAFG